MSALLCTVRNYNCVHESYMCRAEKYRTCMWMSLGLSYKEVLALEALRVT